MGAAQLAVLAALGIAEVPVRRRVRIAAIATGNELVPPGRPLSFGQIHESNGLMLAALARDSAAEEVVLRASVRDDPDALRAVLLDVRARQTIPRLRRLRGFLLGPRLNRTARHTGCAALALANADNCSGVASFW